jgi:hypothetical protein
MIAKHIYSEKSKAAVCGGIRTAGERGQGEDGEMPQRHRGSHLLPAARPIPDCIACFEGHLLRNRNILIGFAVDVGAGGSGADGPSPWLVDTVHLPGRGSPMTLLGSIRRDAEVAISFVERDGRLKRRRWR